MASTVKYTGSPLASGYVKLASNSVLGIVAESAGELLRVSERAGVDRALAIEMILHAFARAPGKKQQLLERDSKPGDVGMRLVLKLAKIALVAGAAILYTRRLAQLQGKSHVRDHLGGRIALGCCT
jgi:3-hydroxyisobutyrate dehydrogenase-like beta-hydroxyacid dehydrogenase